MCLRDGTADKGYVVLLEYNSFRALERRCFMSQRPSIPGYDYGSANLPTSPVSLEDFELLKKSVLFSDEDVRYLRISYDVLKDQVEDILDVWYGFVGDNPHLLYYFTDKGTGEPIESYLNAVRKRFGQWILDTASANYDQQWLNYQYEIGLRHHRSKKNQTDNVSSVDHIPFRYLVALFYPITYTLKPFLAKKGHSAEDVDKMHQAWMKSVLLQLIIWSYPYVKEGDF